MEQGGECLLKGMGEERPWMQSILECLDAVFPDQRERPGRRQMSLGRDPELVARPLPAAQGTRNPHGTQGSGYSDPEGKGLCHKQGGIGAPGGGKCPGKG